MLNLDWSSLLALQYWKTGLQLKRVKKVKLYSGIIMIGAWVFPQKFNDMIGGFEINFGGII